MEPSSTPRGLILDLVTPLRANGELDERGLDRLLGRALPHVQGVWICSPYAGEGQRLDGGRREELLRKSLAAIRGRVPLFVWVTRETPQSTLDTLRRLENQLAVARYPGRVFWVDTPLYYQGNRGLARYYRSVAPRFAHEWVLHNDPNLIRPLGRPFKRVNIRTSILKEIVGIEAVRGLIFSGPMERAHNYQKAVRTRTEFRIYDGEESRFLSHPSLSGVVSAGANLVPKAWQRIAVSTLNLSGSRTEYPDRLRQLWETGEHLRNLLELYAPYPAPLIKTALAEMGVIESPSSVENGDELERRMKGLRALLRKKEDQQGPPEPPDAGRPKS